MGIRKPIETQRDYSAIGKRYAEQVVSGEILACRWARLACQRQLDDLARPPGAWLFSEEHGNKVCRFIENLPHVKGRWKSKNIELEPWQCFIITAVFGWVDAEGFRRFTTVYEELPRKNAKTTKGAAIALYMLCADGEPGAEVYSAAVTKDQAKISWDMAGQMVRRETDMQAFYGVEPQANSIFIAGDGSFFKPLARDADSLEGKSPHFALVDELHAHKTREVWDVLNVGRGSRRQSLMWAITTAGDNKTGICYEQHDYVEKILQGRLQDDRYFGIIYTIDPEDDWTLEESQRKANPNFGVSVLIDDIQTMARQAEASAASQNNYLTKRLNVWVSVGTAYFNLLAWDNRCKNPGLMLEDFYGKSCVMSLDLASRSDIAAKLMVFHEGNKRQVFAKYYLPESAAERGAPNYDVYSGWAKEGWLTLTPGNIIDFEFIEADLLTDFQQFDVREVAFDPWQATELSTRMLKEGLPMVEVGATVRNFSEPMKQLGALIMSAAIEHNGDPVLGWMLGNVYAQTDAKDNVYPRKARNENKIDGAVALIMALNRELVLSGDTSVISYTGLRSVG